MIFPSTEIATALAVFRANVLSPGSNVFNTIAIALGSGRRAAQAYARIGRWRNAGVGVFFGTLGTTLLLSVAEVGV